MRLALFHIEFLPSARSQCEDDMEQSHCQPAMDMQCEKETNFFSWRLLSFGGRLLLQQNLAYGKLTQDLALIHSGSNGEDMMNREELCW